MCATGGRSTAGADGACVDRSLLYGDLVDALPVIRDGGRRSGLHSDNLHQRIEEAAS
jgi:hypothetical protein